MHRVSSFPVLIILSVLALVGFCLIPEMPMSWSPTPTHSTITISATYPQASPLEVERSLISGLESEMASLDEVDNIYSVSSFGGGMISIRFKPGAELSFKLLDVRSRVQRFYESSELPLPFPEITEGNKNSELTPWFLSYSVSGNLSPEELQEEALPLIRQKFSLLPGLEEMTVEGKADKWLEIRLFPNRMRQFQILHADVLNALSKASKIHDLGLYEEGSSVFGLAVKPADSLLIDPGLIPVGRRGARNILLRDVAGYEIVNALPQSYFRINGQQTLSIHFKAREGVNQIDLADRIYPLIMDIRSLLPAGVSLTVLSDETIYLRKELSVLFFRSGLGLAFLVLLLYLWTVDLLFTTLLVSGLLLTIGISFFMLYLFGVEIHLYSLAGLTVSLGLIIDNSILMLDSLTRGATMSSQRSLKALWPIMAATFTSLTGLICVFFLPEDIQSNLIDFCVTVAICLLVSLLIAGIGIPALVAQSGWTRHPKHPLRKILGKPSGSEIGSMMLRLFTMLQRRRAIFLTVFVLTFGLPVFLLPEKLAEGTPGKELYASTIGSDLYQKNLKSYVEKSLGGVSRLFYLQSQKSTFTSDAQRAKIKLSAAPSNGWTPAQLNQVIQRFEQRILKYEHQLDQIQANIVSGQEAYLSVTFTEAGEQEKLPRRLKTELQQLTLEYSDIQWSIESMGMAFDNYQESQANFSVTFRGYEYAGLDRLINRFADSLRVSPRITKVNPHEVLSWSSQPREVMALELQASSMARNQVTTASLIPELQLSSQDWTPQAYFPDPASGERIPIRLKKDGFEEQDLHHLLHAPLLVDSQAVRLKEVGRVIIKPSSSEVHKENQQYIRILSYTYLGTQSFGKKHLKTLAEKFEPEMLPGYSLAIPDGFSISAEKRNERILSIGLIIGLIFVICTVLFESLVYPLIVIAIIPLAYLGMFATFTILQIPFDQGAFASLMLLAGLAVNHTLFLLYHIRHVPNRSAEVILRIFQNKLLPVGLTTLSTCVGLLPILLDGQNSPFWDTFAWGVIGGLLPATVLIFIVLPMLLKKTY